MLILPVHSLSGNFSYKMGWIDQTIPSFPQPRFTCRVDPSCTLQSQGPQPDLEEALPDSPHQKHQTPAFWTAAVGAAKVLPAANQACNSLGAMPPGVKERKSKQEIRGYNSDPSFVASVLNTAFA